jgi:hypothetical protein
MSFITFCVQSRNIRSLGNNDDIRYDFRIAIIWWFAIIIIRRIKSPVQSNHLQRWTYNNIILLSSSQTICLYIIIIRAPLSTYLIGSKVIIIIIILLLLILKTFSRLTRRVISKRKRRLCINFVLPTTTMKI